MDGEDGSGHVIDGSWRDDDDAVTCLLQVGSVSVNRYSHSAADIRDSLFL